MQKKDLQRRAIEDLVRIESELAKLLPLDHDTLLSPVTPTSWSPAELGLHIVLTMEDCAARFQDALDKPKSAANRPSLAQKLAQKAVLLTFRFPVGKLPGLELEPKIMFDRETLVRRLTSSRDSLLDLERKLPAGDSEIIVEHSILGPMGFYSSIRMLLIYVLHHKQLVSKSLRE